jgi:hypothetical protein
MLLDSIGTARCLGRGQRSLLEVMPESPWVLDLGVYVV